MIVRRAGVLLVTIIAMAATGCGTPGPAASVSTAASASPTRSLAIASATASAAASPQPSSPGAFRVVGLVLTADPAAHVGPCPLEITFSAAITVAGGTGTATYHWVSSDGDTSPTKTVEVREGHPMNVSSTWTVDPAHNPTHAGWSRIELVGPHTSAPASVESAEAQFAFTCDTDDDVESIGF